MARRWIRITPLPIPGSECPLHGLRAVSAACCDRSYSVFLLEREPGRQPSEPTTSAGDRAPSLRRVGFGRGTVQELKCLPCDPALARLEQPVPGCGAALADERVRILCRCEGCGVHDENRRTRRGSCRPLDSTRRGRSARIVAVKANRYALEPKSTEPFEGLSADSGTTERSDILDAVRAQMMNVEQTLDQHELTLR